MKTITIKIRNDKAIKLIHDLEDLNLIEIVNEEKRTNEVKLSEILSGSISTELANRMRKELKQMRDEWQ